MSKTIDRKKIHFASCGLTSCVKTIMKYFKLLSNNKPARIYDALNYIMMLSGCDVVDKSIQQIILEQDYLSIWAKSILGTELSGQENGTVTSKISSALDTLVDIQQNPASALNKAITIVGTNMNKQNTQNEIHAVVEKESEPPNHLFDDQKYYVENARSIFVNTMVISEATKIKTLQVSLNGYNLLLAIQMYIEDNLSANPIKNDDKEIADTEIKKLKQYPTLLALGKSSEVLKQPCNGLSEKLVIFFFLRFVIEIAPDVKDVELLELDVLTDVLNKFKNLLAGKGVNIDPAVNIDSNAADFFFAYASLNKIIAKTRQDVDVYSEMKFVLNGGLQVSPTDTLMIIGACFGMHGTAQNTSVNQDVKEILTIFEKNSTGNSKYVLSLVSSFLNSAYPILSVKTQKGGRGSESLAATAILTVVLVLASFVPR